jgi:hypothetical protein
MKKMVKYSLFCIAISIFSISLEGQETNSYPLIEVKIFDIGKGDEQLGYDSSQIVKQGPTGIGFSNQGRLYVLDYFNNMLKIGNARFDLIKAIKIDDDTWSPITLLVTKDIIIGLNSYRASYIKNDGIVKNLIWHENAFNPIKVAFIPNYCFSYSDNELTVFLFDSKEKAGYRVLNESATYALIDTPEKYGLIGVTIDGKNRLFINGKLETRDYRAYMEYWAQKYNFVNVISFCRDSMHKVTPYSEEQEGINYLGEDINGNIIWSVYGMTILVFTRKGQCINKFDYDNNKCKTLPAIHPSGDVYFLDYDKEGVYLYRVENVTVTAPNVRLRNKPSLTGEEAGYLQTDERVVILETSAEKMKVGSMNAPWYRVKTKEGVDAWAFGGFIEKDE